MFFFSLSFFYYAAIRQTDRQTDNSPVRIFVFSFSHLSFYFISILRILFDPSICFFSCHMSDWTSGQVRARNAHDLSIFKHHLNCFPVQNIIQCKCLRVVSDRRGRYHTLFIIQEKERGKLKVFVSFVLCALKSGTTAFQSQVTS